MDSKRILALEPYYGGSHKQWIDGLKRHSQHEIDVLTMPPRKWKWRMRGAAITLAEQFHEKLADQRWDAVLASSMVNLADFAALTRHSLYHARLVYYLHENQITYPLHPDERIDYHFALTNLVSVLAADLVVFNSEYNKLNFFAGIQTILSQIADIAPSIDSLNEKREPSHVICPGVELSELGQTPIRDGGPPVILWNHRWDRDKQPGVFADALLQLHQRGVEFRVIICGEQFRETPDEFDRIKQKLGKKIVHFGYAASRAAYADLLAKSDIVVSTSTQEFFGLSVVEAVYSGAFPILPNRLNYPYLIPNEFHAQILYKTGEELPGLIERTIERAKKGDLPNLKTYVTQYGWDAVAPMYDSLF